MERHKLHKTILESIEVEGNRPTYSKNCVGQIALKKRFDL